MDLFVAGGVVLKAALPHMAKAIAATVQTKLHPSELERAIATALEESEALRIQQKAWNPVFSQCEPNKIDEFLAKWLEHSAVQGELQKPLQEKGLPDAAVLVKAAEQVGNDRAIPIDRYCKSDYHPVGNCVVLIFGVERWGSSIQGRTNVEDRTVLLRRTGKPRYNGDIHLEIGYDG